MQAGRSGAGDPPRSAYEWSLALPWRHLWRPVRTSSAWVMGRPVWAVLAVLMAAQWAVIGTVAAVARHNGPYYYTGGDATWYWTSAWVLAHGHVPQGVISYGYPALLAPLARVAGANMLAGLPLAMVFNGLVLWPIALLCIYGLAKVLGGRGFAYIATLVWTIFPLAAIPYFYQRYHVRYIDQNLPSSLGLTVTGDFPSLVALLAAAYFAARALSERTVQNVVMAGALTGIAATIKPANLVFLPAPLAALALARRWREVVVFCAALLPALGGLALWKYRGLGYVPAFSHSAVSLAAGPSTAPPAVGFLGLHDYIHVDWHHLTDNMYHVREFTWSLRLITWALVAGIVGLVRRSVPLAVLIGGWLALFIFVKGAKPGVNVVDGSFFRYLAPSFPAFFLELAAIVLLLPVVGRRIAHAARANPVAPIASRRWKILLAVTAVVLAAPVVAIAAFRPLTQPIAIDYQLIDQYFPSDAFPIGVQVHRGAVTLSWPGQASSHARPVYAVYRDTIDHASCAVNAHAASSCVFTTVDIHGTHLVPIRWTTRTRIVDRPPAGTWVYRLVSTISPTGPVKGGDYMLMSRAVTVKVSP